MAPERELASVRARVIAALTRRFGVSQFAVIENATQEAFARAFAHEPVASSSELERWLVRVAHNVVIDHLRREQRVAQQSTHVATVVEPPDSELDDELRLMFLCCHPVLPRAAQIALTLRIAFGFTTEQIARAFLSDERTIAQRLVRAKQRLRDEHVVFEVPLPDELPSRIDVILAVIYQLFTEGYATTTGDAGIDDALCRESLRLVRILTADARLAAAETEALHALIAFHVARLPARRADDGSLLLMHEQDRGRWEPSLLGEAFSALGRSARGDAASRFHLEAGIAACHAASASFAATDWAQIVALYDELRAIAPSPVIDVNRAFAVAMARGPNAGLDELDAIPERDLVARYPYALAVYAELNASLGNLDEARGYLDRALEQQSSPAEHALLRRKRAAL